MKRVLIIAYYFPPLGMGGVQRTGKFVKFLPDFGWEAIVLTVKNVVYYARDESFLDELKKSKIIRTESFDPLRIFHKINKIKKKKQKQKEESINPSFFNWLNRKISPWIFIPDSKILWFFHAVFEAEKFLRFNNIDLIFTTSPPHTAHLVGLWLKKKTGLPWVADFRDKWLGEFYEKIPTIFHRKLNCWLARNVVKNANSIITVSQPITEALYQQSGKKRRNFFTLPNGFDKTDFKEQPIVPKEKFTITYCGTLSPILNPEVFLRSVVQAIQIRPDLKMKLCLQFVGSIYGINLSGMLDRYGLKKMVEIVGYVSHDESIQFLLASDMLLLLIHEESSESMVTGKIFEYLASGKPILAAVPDGEAKKLILKYSRGVVVSPSDEKGIAMEIARAYELWKRGDLKITVPRWRDLEVFERKYQTKKLAGVFDEVINC